jgi:glycerol-3-phosphate acyltransferase PlsY
LLSYFLGAIPFGLVIAKLVKGIDVREYGSGNIGTTNVLRTVGRGLSIVVFLCDFGKAVVPVLLARWLVNSPVLEASCAALAVIGHNWPVYLRFRGGKGVAAGFGGFLALSPIAAGIVLVGGGAVMVISRYVSLGAILGVAFAALVTIVMAIWWNAPVEYAVYAVVMGLIIIYRHRGNIARLRAGNERKIGEKAENLASGVNG